MTRQRLQVSNKVIERLKQVKDESSAYLFGLVYDNTLLVVGFTVESKLDIKQITSSEEKLQRMLNFSSEVELCGIVIFDSNRNSIDLGESVLNVLQEVQVTDNPVLLSCDTEIKAKFYIHQKLTDTSYETVDEMKLWKKFVHIRVQTRLPLICELHPEAVAESLKAIRKKVNSGMSSFHMPRTSLYMMGTDGDNWLTGLTGESTLGQLMAMCFEIGEGGSHKAKKKSNGVTDIDVLNMKLLMKPTLSVPGQAPNNFAPVIQHVKRKFECLQMLVRVDALARVSRDTKLANLYEALVNSVDRNLKLTEQCLVEQLSGLSGLKGVPPRLPEPCHFLLPNCGHFITLCYPQGFNDDQLVGVRRALHKELALPLDRPYFRRGNRYLFPEDLPRDAPLLNPHLGLPPSGVKGGEVHTVDGLYSYHHYMQGGTNDDGWGCAYRSLQTIVSWFKLQGYTERAVPTHKEIQQCLIELGDKPASFLGSRQWIGSTEVSFCLESLLGVSSRILSVSSGEELSSKGRDLVQHFTIHGTPIMIGGGVLAHTILGVDFSSLTGELRFLILDPHYTGSEDLGVIQGKGWCGWKGMNFWVEKAYYNLCLPQRPQCM